MNMLFLKQIIAFINHRILFNNTLRSVLDYLKCNKIYTGLEYRWRECCVWKMYHSNCWKIARFLYSIYRSNPEIFYILNNYGNPS